MKKITIAALFWTAAMAYAGPFGLNPGATLEEVRKSGAFVDGREEYSYVTKSLVNGHPDFQSYAVWVTPREGLCRVVAITGDVYVNAYGRQIKDMFRKLTSALESKYGTPRISLDISKTVDLSKNFGFWNLDGVFIDDDAWMDSLLAKRRTLRAEWQDVRVSSSAVSSDAAPASRSVDSLVNVTLEGIAKSPSTAYLRLDYQFGNFTTCQASVKAKSGANL